MSDDNLNFYDRLQKIMKQFLDADGGFAEDFENSENIESLEKLEEIKDQEYDGDDETMTEDDNNENDNEEKKFICEECGCENNDYISLVDHTMIYHDKYYKDEYVDDYLSNKSNKVEDEDINENINTDEDLNGKFECIVCNKKYASVFHLGEHFTNDHTNYETLNSLDNYIRRDGYPSFDILRHLNMIRIEPYKKIEDFRKSKIKCNICNGNYHFSYKLKCNKNKINFNDDMILNKKIKHFNITKDDNTLDEIIIKDVDLIKMNDEIKKLKHPITLTCCNNIICNLCLVDHLKNKNDVICIYCLKDFNDYDNKFIEIMEPEQTNKSWKKWWKKHKDLFE